MAKATGRVLPNLAQQENELERLRRENAALKAARTAAVRFRVTDKGGVSVYGLGQRFPCTLYLSGWEALFDNIDRLRAFIDENRDRLSSKDDD